MTLTIRRDLAQKSWHKHIFGLLSQLLEPKKAFLVGQERWQSGLMRSLGKRVRANTLRGFESLPLRHNKQTYLTRYLSHD